MAVKLTGHRIWDIVDCHGIVAERGLSGGVALKLGFRIIQNEQGPG